MDTLSLAWRNIWRNPLRSILTILAIAFASMLLVFMLSFQFGTYEEMINASVNLTTGHIQVQGPGYNDKREIRKVVSDPEAIMKAIRAMDGVHSVSARSEAFALGVMGKRTRGVMVMGVDPEKERLISKLPSLVREGHYLTGDDSGQAVVGSLLARRLKLDLGDEITLLGQGRDGSVAATVARVKGIFHAGIDELDRTVLQIPTRDFDSVFSMAGAVHKIILTCDSLESVGHVEQEIAQLDLCSGLAVLDWDSLIPGLKQSIQIDLVSGLIMYLVLVIVVAFSILNTFLMAIIERTHEFGVLMAIGTRPGRLVKLMMSESMLMTGVGLAMGMLAGTAITLFFAHHGIDMGESSELMAQYGISGVLHPRLSLLSLFAGPLVVLIVTFLTALYPVFRIPGMRPVEALRSA